MLVFERRVQARSLDPRGGTGGRDLEHGEIALAERPRMQRSDMEHADQVTLDDQRHAEQRADPLLAQDRIHDVGVVDVGDEDRHALGRDPSREPSSDRDPHALLDLFLDPVRGARDQLLRVLVEQQDRDRVDRQASRTRISSSSRNSSSPSSESAGSERANRTRTCSDGASSSETGGRTTWPARGS